MKNILIPIDGSIYSAKAVEKGLELAQSIGSNVTLLNAIPMVLGPTGRIHYDVHQMHEEHQKASEEMLLESKKKFEGINVKVETVSMYGSAADVIIDYAKSNGIDLVIMGSHGLGAVLNRMLTGSTTTKVLHHIEIPVLVVK